MLRRRGKQFEFDRERLDGSHIRGRLNLISPAPAIGLNDSRSLTSLALAGCDREGQSGNSQTAQKTEAVPAEVSAVTIEPKTLPVTFEAVGHNEVSREVEVRAPVGSNSAAPFYTESSWVKRGTLLLKIDPRRSRAEEAQGRNRKDSLVPRGRTC